MKYATSTPVNSRRVKSKSSFSRSKSCVACAIVASEAAPVGATCAQSFRTVAGMTMSNGRRAIARRLVELRSKGGRAVPLALAHVGSRDRETRMRAFEVLRDWGKPTHAPLAIKGLDDPEDTVVVSAIECLVEWNVRASAAK